MKKSLLVCIVLPFIFAACSSNEPGGGGKNDSDKVLGKSFKNYWVEEYSVSVQEVTTYADFPHSRVCHIHGYGGDYSEYGVDNYSFDRYYEYKVDGNEVILYDLETEEIDDQYRFTIVGDNLQAGSDIYLANGTVDIDEGLDSKLPPDGKRTYIPVGWYDSGLLEYMVKSEASMLADMGDTYGLNNLPYEMRERMDFASAIRIVDKNTLQTAYPAITTSRTDWYTVHTFGGVLYYYYFETYLGEYKYRVIDGDLYVRNYAGDWELMGSYEEGRNYFECGSINDELVSLGGTYTKVSYDGGYRYY